MTTLKDTTHKSQHLGELISVLMNYVLFINLI